MLRQSELWFYTIVMSIGRAEVKSLWSMCVGLHTCYKGELKGKRRINPEHTPKTHLSADCLLKLEGMK